MKNLRNIILVITAVLTFSCSSKKEETKPAEVAQVVKNEITLTEEQFKSIAPQLGTTELRSLSKNIKANGMLDVPPQNLVSISAPLGGFVKSTELLQGMHVNKGQVIVVMEHPDYIQLQQDYLDSKNQLEFQEQEYKRQQDLAKENVNALKSLQQAKSNYFSTKAKVQGLLAKLKMININPAELEAGEIRSTISLTTPIEGYVAQVHVNLGQHVSPTDVMFRIVDTHHLHAEAQVFEKDIPELKIGQLVRIRLSNENKERIAKVYLIGKEITAERTVRVHCHLEGEDSSLIPGTFFSASIETGSHQTAALSSDAIVNFEGKTYVFVETDAAKHHYKIVPIEVGGSDSGFYEVAFKEELPKDLKNKIVVKGAYHLLNVLKNVEL
jgi:cobalt-zinc-cadmium efflux system membrane fusion protein